MNPFYGWVRLFLLLLFQLPPLADVHAPRYICSSCANVFIIAFRGDNQVRMPCAVSAAIFPPSGRPHVALGTSFPDSIVVRTPGLHPGNPGSIPGQGGFFSGPYVQVAICFSVRCCVGHLLFFSHGTHVLSMLSCFQ